MPRLVHMAGNFGDICIIDPGMSDLSQNLLLSKSSLLGYSCQDLVSINGQVIFKKLFLLHLACLHISAKAHF